MKVFFFFFFREEEVDAVSRIGWNILSLYRKGERWEGGTGYTQEKGIDLDKEQQDAVEEVVVAWVNV